MIRSALAVVGLFNVANGLYMLFAPAAWYASVPGVVATGPMNPHFIVDIGLAFVASGIGQALGARRNVTAGVFALAGSVWPALHALFHIWGWTVHGFPTEPAVATSELLGVVGVSALGMFLAIRSYASTGVSR